MEKEYKENLPLMLPALGVYSAFNLGVSFSFVHRATESFF